MIQRANLEHDIEGDRCHMLIAIVLHAGEQRMEFLIHDPAVKAKDHVAQLDQLLTDRAVSVRGRLVHTRLHRLFVILKQQVAGDDGGHNEEREQTAFVGR